MADKGKQVAIEISSSSDEDEEYEVRNKGPIQMGTFYQFLNVKDEDDNPEKKRIKKKPRLTLGSSFHATDNTRKDDINNPFQPMETVKEAEEDLVLELDYRPAAKVFPEVPMEVVPEKDKATEEEMSPDNSDNRAPRYFQLPDCNCKACYKYGEDDHDGEECKVKKKKKPCFVCADLGHKGKHRQKAAKIKARKKKIENQKAESKANKSARRPNRNRGRYGTQRQFFAEPQSYVWLSTAAAASRYASNAYGNQYFSQQPRELYYNQVGTQPSDNSFDYQAGIQLWHQRCNREMQNQNPILQQTPNHQTGGQRPHPVADNQARAPPRQNFFLSF